MLSVEVRGLKELRRKLKAAADRIENRAIRTALREGAKPIMEAERSRTRSKRVRRGIRQKMLSTKGKVHSVEIGPNSKIAYLAKRFSAETE